MSARTRSRSNPTMQLQQIAATDIAVQIRPHNQSGYRSKSIMAGLWAGAAPESQKRRDDHLTSR